jgi:hypothetical protein
MRRAAKVDANQPAIVDALRKAGASVECLHRVGAGCPDIIAGFRGTDYLLEIKVPGEKPNDLQSSWHLQWRGRRVAVVRTIAEALTAIGAL